MQRRGGETILSVEADPVLRAMVRKVLRGHGYLIVEAESVGQALDL